MRVQFEPTDLSTVTFLKMCGLNLTAIAKHEMVYAEDLQRLFTAENWLSNTAVGAERINDFPVLLKVTPSIYAIDDNFCSINSLSFLAFKTFIEITSTFNLSGKVN